MILFVVRSRLLTPCLVLLGMVMHLESVEAQQETTYAIVIHGGAGGNSAKWDEAKKNGRLEGLERALTAGRDILAKGGTAMDAVEAAIVVMEDDARFNAGRGAVVTVEGKAELDASIMDGSQLACGAVAGVTNAKNPISLARLVSSETKHVLLAGPGANQFAKEQGVELVEPEYFLSYKNWLHNREVAPPPSPDEESKLGTVGCVALDSHGNLAAGTSTGGTTKKLAGRVGDSPIVGAGTYAANDTCAVSGTGIGEEYIRHAVAYDIVAQMRYAKKSLPDAVTEIMTHRLKAGVGGIIAVSREGEIVMQHNTPGMSCGAADHTGRFEVQLQVE